MTPRSKRPRERPGRLDPAGLLRFGERGHHAGAHFRAKVSRVKALP